MSLKGNDVITAIDHQEIKTWQEMVTFVNDNPDKKVTVHYERGAKQQTTELTLGSKEDPETNQKQGLMGVVKGDRYNTSLLSRLTYGFTATWSVVTGVVSAISGMFRTGFNINNFGGPVAMAQMTSEVVEYGLIPILSFMAWLSANLGIINLMPIPALDGGKIVLNVIEAIRGKPVSQSAEGIITIIGVALLFILMILVTWNDIQRAFF